MARVAEQTDDRGQLLLVGAIGLGVLFVLLALVLNTVIFTETLAPHDDSLRDGRTVRQTQATVSHSIGGLIEHVNVHNATSHEALARNLSDGIATWDHTAAPQLAGGDAVTNVSLISLTNGTRIRQNTTANDSSSRNFTNASGATTWTLAESVSSTRGVRLNITQDALATPTNGTCRPSSECYYIEVANGSATWRLFVSDGNPGSDDANITVRVVNASGGSTTCSTFGAHAWLNISAGTLAGAECPALSFAEGVAGRYAITYHNAHNIVGTYALTVNTAVARTPHYSTDRSHSPSLVPTIYAATVQYTYRTAELRYTTHLRVVPGEWDA